MWTHLATIPRRPRARLALAAAFGGSLLSLACGDPGPTGPGNPFGVQSVALVAAADTLSVGGSVVLSASITAERAVPAAQIQWQVVPAGPLGVREDHRTAEFVPTDPGSYRITVQTGDQSASATVTVAVFPFTGTWRLVALQLREAGGASNPAPFTSGSMAWDGTRHVRIQLVCAAEVGSLCDGPGEVLDWDYPFAHIDGPNLLLCQVPQYCDTVTWAVDGSRLWVNGLGGAEMGFEH